MSTTTDPDQALRELVALADPEGQSPPPATDHLLERVLASAAAPATAGNPAQSVAQLPADPPNEAEAAAAASVAMLGAHHHEQAAVHDIGKRSFRRRHWQAGLLVAAAACSIALAVPTVLPMPGLEGGGDPSASSTAEEPGSDGDRASLDSPEQAPAADGGAVSERDVAGGSAGREAPGALSAEDTASDSAKYVGGRTPGQAAVPEKLVRSASMLVGAEDLQGARDRFVTAILALDGRVNSESVITRESIDRGFAAQESSKASGDYAVTYPNPPYPTGPGIWLTVQVPVDNYDEAMSAARSAGEVVQLQQSSYDVGTQVADVEARIRSLEASLTRLEELMDQAEDVSDVIDLENAIAQRQAELDSLRAQQRSLAEQTDMSAISLALMSPADAKASLEPTPPQTWWDSFLAGLESFWSWFGRALLIVSPLLVAGAVILWIRRRRGPGGPGAAQPAPEGPTEG